MATIHTETQTFDPVTAFMNPSSERAEGRRVDGNVLVPLGSGAECESADLLSETGYFLLAC